MIRESAAPVPALEAPAPAAPQAQPAVEEGQLLAAGGRAGGGAAARDAGLAGGPGRAPIGLAALVADDAPAPVERVGRRQVERREPARR